MVRHQRRHYAGKVNVAARTPVARSLSAGNEESWGTLVANLPSRYNAAVSTVAVPVASAVGCHRSRGKRKRIPPKYVPTSELLESSL